MPQQQSTKRRMGGWLMVTSFIIGLPVCLVWREYQLHRLNHALIAAIRRVDPKAVTSLLDQGADANAIDRYEDFRAWRALLRLVTVQRSLGTGSGLSALWVDLETAGMDAQNGALYGRERQERLRTEESIAEALIAHGADPDPYARYSRVTTTLHTAAYLDWTQMAAILVSRGADVNAKDWGGITPLMYAQETNTRLLLQNGADPNIRDDQGETPLIYARSDPGRVRLLLEAGADPNAKDRYGETPLMNAQTPEIMEMLLKHRADVNIRDRERHTALYQIEYRYRSSEEESLKTMARLLKAHGAHD